MQVELIRHGKTAWSEQGRYQGISDIPLSGTGKDMLRGSEEAVSRVYVTPLQRTSQTAAILFPGAELIPVKGLGEMNFGAFEGRTWQEMETDTAYREWVEGGCRGRCPGGEDLPEYEERVCAAFLEILENEKKAGSEKMVIVAHGGTQMALLGRYGAPQQDYWRWQRPCGCGYELEAVEKDGGLVLEKIRETVYLKREDPAGGER